MPERVALVGCGKAKLDHPAAAEKIYVGSLFKMARAWAIRNTTRWFVLSAKYGLLAPWQIVIPYDAFLPNMSLAERESWASKVGKAVRGQIAPEAEVVLLAGREYGCFSKFVDNRITEPLRGLGIGRRMAWLKENR